MTKQRLRVVQITKKETKMTKVADEKEIPADISMTKMANYDSITKVDESAEDPSQEVKVKGPYPKIVILIILNEFCERFIFLSYYKFNGKVKFGITVFVSKKS